MYVLDSILVLKLRKRKIARIIPSPKRQVTYQAKDVNMHSIVGTKYRTIEYPMMQTA